jgi:predicted nucleic acid-binding protein
MDGARRIEARLYGLPYYDAAYLELALNTSAPLATFDRALMAAARRLGHPLAADLVRE